MKQIVCSCILIACSPLGPGNAMAQGTAPSGTPIDFAEFDAELADLEQCRAKYKDSTIHFTGVFPLNGSASSSLSSPRIYLSKFGGYVVFDDASESVFQKLQEGDRIAFQAEVSGSDKEIIAHDLKLVESFDSRPPIKVSFKNFVKEFKDGPAKASEKYKNQKISFREDLYDVHVYSSGKTSLSFHWGYEFVYCDLRESERQKAEKLKKGKSVAVEGHYEGGTSVRLSNCTIK
jgi:hypothetical protein